MLDFDYFILLGNLIKIEEHLIILYGQEQRKEILEKLKEIRKFRRMLMKEYFNLEGENWCLMKHYISTIYSAFEVIEKENELNKDVDKYFEIIAFCINEIIKMIGGIKREEKEIKIEEKNQ